MKAVVGWQGFYLSVFLFAGVPVRLSLFAVAALCLSTLAAHADTFQVFNLNAVLTNGGTLSGQLNLDLSSAGVSASNDFKSTANVTYTLNGVSVLFNVTNFDFGGVTGETFLQFPDLKSHDMLWLYVPTSAVESLNGFQGGLCTLATPCIVNTYIDTSSNSRIFLASGDLSPATPAQTPEPSSIALLGTGLVGMFGVARRKYMSA